MTPSDSEPQLLLSTSPFVKQQQDVPFVMWQVVFSLLPVVAAAAWTFGVSALLVVAAAVLGAVGAEWLVRRDTVPDGSACITGLLLALTLPPNIPLWMALLGGAVSIWIGKTLFGGIGYNVFNPALVGRAFLQAAFPAAMTTWSPPTGDGGFLALRPGSLALPFAQGAVDGVSTATPLASMKFSGVATDPLPLLLGSTSGSLGETCAGVILLCGLYLAARNLLNWRIPVSLFAAVWVMAFILHGIVPDRCGPPLFHLLSGGVVLGAVFMATDMVTSPVTPLGCWVFGAGIGCLAVIIRVFGGLPEGVMYAILLMNAMTPLINRATQPRIYGATRKAT